MDGLRAVNVIITRVPFSVALFHQFQITGSVRMFRCVVALDQEQDSICGLLKQEIAIQQLQKLIILIHTQTTLLCLYICKVDLGIGQLLTVVTQDVSIGWALFVMT